MKHIHTITLFHGLLMAALLFAACSDGTSLSFSNKKIKQDAPLVEGTDEPHCQLYLQVKLADGDTPAAKAANQHIIKMLFGTSSVAAEAEMDSFAVRYIARYRADLRPFYEADKVSELKAMYNYTYKLTTETESGRGNWFGYLAHREYKEGGVRVVKETRCINLDAATGAQITLDSILTENPEKELVKLLEEALKEKMDCDTHEALEEKGFLQVSDMYVPDNYLIKSSGIRFIFNPDEIAPSEQGKIELTLTNSQLKNILKKDI